MTTIVRRKFRVSRKICSSLWGQAKDPVHNRNYKPGDSGKKSTKKLSSFGNQNRAHKCFTTYYNMGGKQFKRVFNLAYRSKGNTVNNLIALLETRLSSILFHGGLVPSIFAAKQLVSHKHVLVNDSIVNVNNYHVQEGDVLTIKEKSKNIPCVVQAVGSDNSRVPNYLNVDLEKRSIKLLRLPEFIDVPYASIMEPHLVIEYYSQ